MRLALIPVNVRVGDFPGNLKIHRALVKEAVDQGASLLVFPELSLVGYFPHDLLHRPDWSERAAAQLAEFRAWLQSAYPKTAVVVGTTCEVQAESDSPRGLANCAVFLYGARQEVRAKTLIPYYDVFHESRYFDSAASLPESFRAPIEFEGQKIGLLLCEDSWHEMNRRGRRLYRLDPTEKLVRAGCDWLINISASPFNRLKKGQRRETIQRAAKKHAKPIAYVNHFGAHDDILFDGDAFLCSGAGEILGEKAEAGPEPVLVRLDSPAKPGKKIAQAELRDLRRMLVTGIRDYARKNGISRAVLGISGGVDSALVATLAAEAMGAENVIGLAMPSKFSSPHSLEDAEELARNLGLPLRHFPIKMPHSTLSLALKPFFQGSPEGVAEENVQSRLRGLAVMAFANKFGAMALATGNKSEFAMGYATLYGDTCGALAPIGDLYKTEVYELCHFLNGERLVIPERTLTKAPSAELRPNQTDQDSLPPYDVLDAALRLLVDEELAPAAALTRWREVHLTGTLVELEQIHQTVIRNEFKRRQVPPILRVSTRAFGSGRVYPITATY